MVAAAAARQGGAVLYRMAMLAMQGNVKAADHYCRMEADVYGAHNDEPAHSGRLIGDT